MTSKCTKVKNPCKICLQPVSNKTGLQCQGACRKWVHFACLNYTPGKIKDIKKGIIKVTCPCPDCKTSYPKEFRTDEPFNCTNTNCPSNLPRSCLNSACPSNQKMNQTSENNCVPPLAYCEKETCKSHGRPFGPNMNDDATSQSSSDTMCRKANQCSSSDHLSGDTRRGGGSPQMCVMEEICNTVGQLTKQINRLMNEMKNTVQKAPEDSCPPKRITCDRKGPKALCPKPCFCPQNPMNNC